MVDRLLAFDLLPQRQQHVLGDVLAQVRARTAGHAADRRHDQAAVLAHQFLEALARSGGHGG